MRFLLLIVIFSFLCFSCTEEEQNNFCQYVDPFIGTGGHGHTYPGACLPFGMVQVSPDTRLEGWDGCSGYHYSDSVIYGFSHTHLSGTGCSDYGDLLLMPTTGAVCAFNGYPNNVSEGYASVFSHNDETASPGYYSVSLKKYNINVEITASYRSAIHRYSFPENIQKNIIIDLTHRDEVIGSELSFTGNNSVSGFRRSRAWAQDQILYFYIEFSESYIQSGIFENDSLINQMNSSSKGISAFATFNPESTDPVIVRVGISQTSVEAAKKNLNEEIPDFRFDNYVSSAKEEWNKRLGKIEAEGDSVSLVNFYTALYHSYLAPNIASDIDGSYRGADKLIHKCNHNYYTVFSLWDTYRTLHPLMTILETEETNNFIRTFLLMYEQGGLLPVWELASNETFCMIGYHAVPVIFDAYMKGIRDYNKDLAFEAMKNSAMKDHFGLESLKRNGYLTADDEGESVSKTLEYAYDDWCIAMMAKETGNNEEYSAFIKRSQAWKHIFDDQSGFMRARMNGGWFSPFNPSEVNFNYTEANAWQYSFYVPHDIAGLISFMGGNQAFEAKLDSLFSADSKTTGRDQPDITGLIGQYAHGNEPSHHMAYLYNYIAKPHKTQEIVSRIMKEMYSPKPDGICGNEDCGQMSAWYVMSAMGFYPVTPGSNQYIIGRPILNKAVINLENSKKFTITAKNQSPENIYIQKVILNGKDHNKSYISHSDIINGGNIEFIMGKLPSAWANNSESSPSTSVNDFPVIPASYINTNSRAFRGKTTISLGTSCKNCRIFFTTIGNQPDTTATEYSEPFEIDKDVVIRSVAIDPENNRSPVTETRLHCIPEKMSVKLLQEYNSQYSAGGSFAMIDRIRGGNNFRNGIWQGYQGTSVEIIVDLGETRQIKKTGAGFLQDTGPWILFPEKVIFSLSENGKNFKEVSVIKNETPKSQMDVVVKDFASEIKAIKARYIKMTAVYPGDLPAWHQGAGYPSFIFIDEIFWE